MKAAELREILDDLAVEPDADVLVQHFGKELEWELLGAHGDRTRIVLELGKAR